MSVAIVMNVHDGVILAADTASTLVSDGADHQPGKPPVTPDLINLYNNANKIANLYQGLPIGCVTFGSGSIGTASMSTLPKNFRQELGDGDYRERFDPNHYTIEGVA